MVWIFGFIDVPHPPADSISFYQIGFTTWLCWLTVRKKRQIPFGGDRQYIERQVVEEGHPRISAGREVRE